MTRWRHIPRRCKECNSWFGTERGMEDHMKDKHTTTLMKPRGGVIVDLAPLLEFQRALSGDVIWTTRERRRVLVKEMETSHIHNTVRMLRGQSPHGTAYRCDDLTRANWLEIFNIELEKRGALLEG